MSEFYFSIATDQSRVDETLTELISKNCKVTLVLFDDESPEEFFGFLEGALGLAPESLKPRVRHAREHFLALRNSLAPTARDLFEDPTPPTSTDGFSFQN